MTTPSEHSPHHLSIAVGYQFVRQYYTVLSKDPAKLHCFYKKNSLFTHGEEGVNREPAVGQIAINTEIAALDFQNCKVVVSQLDAQPSANDGVIIMVLGTMSNKGGADRRFAQTFFLISEEPGRYYVLNDLFWYLVEPTVNATHDNTNYEQHASTQTEHHEVHEPATESPAPVETKTEVEVPAAAPVVHETPFSAPAPVEEIPAPAPAPAPVAAAAPAPAPVAAAAPAPAAAAPTPVAAAAAAAPTPAAPKQKPSSWASAAAAPPAPKTAAPKAAPPKAAPAASAPAVAAAPSPVSAPAASPAAEPAQEQAKQEKVEKHERPERSERRPPIDYEHDSSVFVNNITQDMENDLKTAFSQFGPVKQVALLKNNTSAFIDFTSHEHAEAAIAAGSVTLPDGKVVKAERRNRPRGTGSGSGFGGGQGRRPQNAGPREPRENGAPPRRREENGSAPRREDRPPRRENAPAAPGASGAKKPVPQAQSAAPQSTRQK